MSFLNRKDSGENILVVDISSGSTAAALVHTDPKGTPALTSKIRTPFTTGSNPAEEYPEVPMLASLRTTLASIAKDIPNLSKSGYGSAVHRALVTFSSPWLRSHLKTVILAKPGGFVLDKSMLRNVISEEEVLFRERLRNDNSSQDEIFESAITNLYLNGYESEAPLSDRVEKAEVSFLLSAASRDLLRSVGSELVKSIGIRRGMATHSFMFAFFKVLSHSFQSLHSALLIDMTLEFTDVLFLRHGSSAFAATLAFGPASIAKAVAEKLGIPIQLAYSYLSLFASGVLDQATTGAIDSVFIEVEEKWISLWRQMDESIPEGSAVPYSVFLVVPSGFEKLMKTFLESVLTGRRIILLGDTNTFTRELVRASPEMLGDEKILLLSSFSNLLK
ncbi:hypothetical protein KW796_00915 [Candidatus Parcubacteria bacterium]|nr:hypothetical protein [Candidatus Parcubacteria bacterium]